MFGRGTQRCARFVRPKTVASVGVIAALLAGTLIGTAPAYADDPPPPPPGPAWVPPSSGALWGAFASLDAHNGTTRQAAVTSLETKAGRQMAVDRVFYGWGQPCTDADDVWDEQNGRIPFISMDAGGAHKVLWSQIADGSQDAFIDACAASLASLSGPVFFSFQHEPDNHLGGKKKLGTIADYVAAWQHVHDRIVADGAINVTFVQILMASTLRKGRGDLFYAGDGEVDFLAADGYNWYGCKGHPGPWVSPSWVFSGLAAWGAKHSKPLMIAEWGTGEDPAKVGRKAQWITSLGTWVQAHPSIKAVSLYNTAKVPSCPRYADSSPESLAAFDAVGAQPWFNPVPAVPENPAR
jgi:hypothetical protein